MTSLSLFTANTTAPSRGRLGTLAAFASRVWAEFASRRAARSVEMLSDEGLRDIGITRSEIESAVRFGRHHRY